MEDFKIEMVGALKENNFDKYLELLENNFPKNIYRYCKHDDQTIDLITQNKIRIIKPTSFNDPFDSLVNELNPAIKNQKFDVDIAIQKILLSKNDKIKKLQKIVNDNYLLKNELSYNQKAKILHNAIDELQRDCSPLDMGDINGIRSLIDKFWGFTNKFIRQPIIENAGITCFSEKKDNILMWAHYSNFCSGFCLKYNSTQILDGVKNGKYFFVPVIYQKYKYAGYSDPISFDSLKKLWNLPQFMYKAEEWEYEKEWRVVIPEFSQEIIDFAKIEAIYFGTNFETVNPYITKEKNNSEEDQIKKYKELMKFSSDNKLRMVRLKPRGDICYGFDECLCL